MGTVAEQFIGVLAPASYIPSAHDRYGEGQPAKHPASPSGPDTASWWGEQTRTPDRGGGGGRARPAEIRDRDRRADRSRLAVCPARRRLAAGQGGRSGGSRRRGRRQDGRRGGGAPALGTGQGTHPQRDPVRLRRP